MGPVLAVFGAIPALYFLIFAPSPLKISIYLTTILALLIGFATTRSICKLTPWFTRANDLKFNEALAEHIIQGMLGCMLIGALIATKSIVELGADYRLLFFIDQTSIFGYERFGFFLQIFTEYGALALFSIALSRSSNTKWTLYLFAWVILGTIITLGRWYILYALLLYISTTTLDQRRFAITRSLTYAIIALCILFGSSLIFVCRGGECSISPEVIFHGIRAGISSYFFIPIEMIAEYHATTEFSFNLLIGFAVYPLDIIGRITGLYSLNYEYDQWALLVQNYVALENLGSYNAMVGQPLTSYVAMGHLGIVFHYVLAGSLIGIAYSRTAHPHPIAILSCVITVTSYLIPTLSGPMFFVSLFFYFILSNILGQSFISRNLRTISATTR